MHISVEGVFLVSLEFELLPENNENLSYDLKVQCRSHYPEKNLLVQEMDFDVTHDVETPPFRMKFSFLAKYRSEGEGEPTLEEFAQANAPAYVMPYARELIANITSRTGILPTLVIPPVNIFSLIDKGMHKSDELMLEFEDRTDNRASDTEAD